jgi:hypothetical protein
MTTQLLSAGYGPLYVDPQNPDLLYFMGTAMYRSTDGGRHLVAYKGSPGGDDPRNLWIDPTNPRRMLMGVDQGPTISVDGGATWTPWFNLPNGQFYHVSTDSLFPYHVCGAQQDSGTACVSSRSDFGEIRDNDWYPVGGFEDGYIVADPLNRRWIFTQGWYHVLRRYDRETGQVAVLYTPSDSDRFGSAPPLAFSPQNARLLYMGAQYVLASSDGARDWQRISPDLTVHSRPGDTARRSASLPRFRATIETLSPSTVKSGEIWVGTSNGVIQLTQDGGTSWTDVTPPSMPAALISRISIVDASHTEAGTAYAAVQAFRDAHPYIYRTTDYGQHWQLIVSGLPTDAAVRVVREDPAQPNLLFAGTETGAWVSFDRGDHWQSLQLNLPNTVISDMTVHGTDLDISTYGRALWILDDITPLRQAPAVASASRPFLVEPAAAYRVRWDNIEDTPLPPEVPMGDNPPEGAILDYYLPAPATGTVTLSIRDGQGHLIREYSSVTPPKDTVEPNIAPYWLEPPIVLPTAQGSHRIAWDLRYPLPSVINYSYFGDLLNYREYTLNTHAVSGHTPIVQPTGPLVVPGTYQVSLSVGGETSTRQVTVINDPRVQISPTGLSAQLDLQLEIVAGLRVSFDQFARLQALREALSADSAKSAKDSGLLAAIRAVDAQAAAAASAADTGVGPANRDLTRHLEDMESGDVDPSPSTRAAVTHDCAQIDAALAMIGRWEAGDWRSLDGRLRAAGLTPLPLEPVPTGPACRADGGAALR